MEGTVINNSDSNTIIAYMTYTSKTTNLAPDLKTLQTDQISLLGHQTPSDAYISGQGDNIYAGVWDGTSKEGTPNSWIIISTKDAKIINQHFDKYSLNARGNKEKGWVLTVTTLKESINTSSSSPTHGTTIKWWVVVLTILAILFVIGGSVGIYFAFKNRRIGGSVSGSDSKRPLYLQGL